MAKKKTQMLLPFQREIMRGLFPSFELAARNNEFLLFWLIGVLMHIIVFNTFNTWEWIAIAVLDWICGAAGIGDTILGVEKAFAHCGVSFTDAYGTPKWIFASKYPCTMDTLEFTACGHPAKSYQDQVGRIAAGLKLPVQNITEDRPGAQILQAHIVRSEIPKTVSFKEMDILSLGQGQFFYGKTDKGTKRDDLKDAIHMLVAGQTGSGKTHFIQQVVMTILMRSRNAHAAIIDMKGGIDFPEFLPLKNCELVTTHKGAHEILDALYKIHEARTQYLLAKGKRNWRDLSLKDLVYEKQFAELPIGPILLVTDELGELTGYSKGSGTKLSILHRLSQFSRLSRATGIHLIVGTQRPDKSIIDGQIKENLVTKICFLFPPYRHPPLL